MLRVPLVDVMLPKPLPVKVRLPRAKNGWFSQLEASAYRRMFTRSEKRIFFAGEEYSFLRTRKHAPVRRGFQLAEPSVLRAGQPDLDRQRLRQHHVDQRNSQHDSPLVARLLDFSADDRPHRIRM